MEADLSHNGVPLTRQQIEEIYIGNEELYNDFIQRGYDTVNRDLLFDAVSQKLFGCKWIGGGSYKQEEIAKFKRKVAQSLLYFVKFCTDQEKKDFEIERVAVTWIW